MILAKKILVARQNSNTIFVNTDILVNIHSLNDKLVIFLMNALIVLYTNFHCEQLIIALGISYNFYHFKGDNNVLKKKKNHFNKNS